MKTAIAVVAFVFAIGLTLPAQDESGAGARAKSQKKQSQDWAYSMIAVRHADAAELVSIVHQLVEPTSRSGFRLMSDARTNSILVMAKPPVQKAVAKVITSLDIPTGKAPAVAKPVTRKKSKRPEYGFASIALEFAQSQQVQFVVTELMGVLAQGRFQIVGDARTNSVLVAATGADLEKIRSIVASLDVAVKQPGKK